MPHVASHAWQSMYPPRQCHDGGWLAVGDGHAIRWEVSGNPLGQPALFLHGGPGAGCRSDDRRWFDPAHYRIVLFDQRGAGRSRPRGALHHNTTGDLLDDMEALREHLHVDDWLLFGGSWGATLALAYAQRHPRRVRAIVLRGVFLATAQERHWLYAADGAAARYAKAARSFLLAGADEILPAYQRQLQGDDAQAVAAARAWVAWEQALMRLESGGNDGDEPCVWSIPQNDIDALGAARIGVHYACSNYFLEEAQLLRDAASLRDIAGVIVQGELDLVTPPFMAQALHSVWPGSRLVMLPDAGHASSDPSIARELVAATDRFRN